MKSNEHDAIEGLALEARRLKEKTDRLNEESDRVARVLAPTHKKVFLAKPPKSKPRNFLYYLGLLFWLVIVFWVSVFLSSIFKKIILF